MENEQEEEQAKAESRKKLVEVIRRDSAAAGLTSSKALEAALSKATHSETSIAELLPHPDYTDVRRLDGESDSYFFSTLSVTESYARYLYRVEEKNPLRLIADTVREESRIYPRPTPLRYFKEPPFRLSDGELEALVAQFGPDTGTADIAAFPASNGELYLFSTDHLEKVHGESLVEYYEVERWQNP